MAVGPPSAEDGPPPGSVGLPYLHMLAMPKGSSDLGGVMRRAPSQSNTAEETANKESCSDGFTVSSNSRAAVVSEPTLEESQVNETGPTEEDKAACGLALLSFAIENRNGNGEQEADNTPTNSFSQQRRNCKLLQQSSLIKFPESRVRKGDFRLLVEVLSASNLANPQYRVGDIASSLVCGTPATFSAVYVTVGIGEDQKLNTKPAQNPDGSNQVKFVEEKLLFHYHGEAECTVEVFDHRELQGVFGGDPLIGEAALPLKLRELCAGHPRSCTLKLSRRLRGPRLPGASGYVDGGTVVLRFQIVERPDRNGY